KSCLASRSSAALSRSSEGAWAVRSTRSPAATMMRNRAPRRHECRAAPANASQAELEGSGVGMGRSEGQFGLRGQPQQLLAEFLLDAGQARFGLGLEAQHDDRGGIGGARQPEAVRVLRAHAVYRNQPA